MQPPAWYKNDSDGDYGLSTLTDEPVPVNIDDDI